ncbi:MAG: hypothetical protein JXB26_00705 [Candidatus Aminicenantes bacterium]|nr:hypothetical protein [Candidatus Aminicenantes bacterium]
MNLGGIFYSSCGKVYGEYFFRRIPNAPVFRMVNPRIIPVILNITQFVTVKLEQGTRSGTITTGVTIQDKIWKAVMYLDIKIIPFYNVLI